MLRALPPSRAPGRALLSSAPRRSPSSLGRRTAAPLPPHGYSRVPFESLDPFEPPPRRRRRRRRHPDDEADGDGVDYGDFEEGDGDEIDAASSGDTPLSLSADALPGTQVARLRSLQEEAEARRDAHFTMYRAHSWKANLLSAIVLVCTTAGGTSGLISLTANSGGGGPPSGGGSTGFSGIPMGAGGGGGGSNAAALLSPILGYAATLFSGWQQYAKPSTTASRHLTAAKRYQVIARHVRDALAYGAVSNYALVIQAVERKFDQYDDESPCINISTDAPPPGSGAAFFSALFELPE